MKIITDLSRYFGTLLFNVPCIRLCAMTCIYYYTIVHKNPPQIIIFQQPEWVTNTMTYLILVYL